MLRFDIRILEIRDADHNTKGRTMEHEMLFFEDEAAYTMPQATFNAYNCE